MRTAEKHDASDLSEIERTHYQKIRELESKCSALEDEYETAKADATARKSAWSAAVSELRSCIRGGPNAQTELAFGHSWHDTPIEQAITVTAKQLETLHDAGVATVEDFEALRAGKLQGYRDGLRDLPRVGQATADKWEDEILDWIGENGRLEPDVVDDQDEDEEDSDGVA